MARNIRLSISPILSPKIQEARKKRLEEAEKLDLAKLENSKQVKKYRSLEKEIHNKVDKHDCMIDMDTGELLSIDYWYDMEGIIPRSQRFCEIEPSKADEIKKLYDNFKDLETKDNVIDYNEALWARRERASQQRQLLFKKAAKECRTKSDFKEFQKCLLRQ